MVIFGCACGASMAQQGPIETDRPDQASTPATVPKGSVQLETGAVRTVPQDGSPATWTLPDVLLKAGLTSWLEFRSGVGWSQFRDGARLTERSLRPLVLGGKAGIWKAEGTRTRTSVLAEMGVPGTGNGAGRTDEPFGSLLVLADHGFSGHVVTTLNAGVQWDGTSPVGVPVYALSTGFDLSQRLKGFMELYGKLPVHATADHRWDSGLTWRLTDDVQFDASGGRGFGDPEWFLNMGVSVRFRAWGKRP
jgi:hypothetical protein